jgi:hypothetical protein
VAAYGLIFPTKAQLDDVRGAGRKAVSLPLAAAGWSDARGGSVRITGSETSLTVSRPLCDKEEQKPLSGRTVVRRGRVERGVSWRVGMVTFR